MSTELEIAGAASLGALSPGGKADLSGQPCRNCGEMVEQRHCPKCGQLAASFHRPFFSLITESISDSFALDGRIARTLPLLLFRPGVLTRRYAEGKRARYMPPFRMFLLSSLIFYFVVFAFVGQASWLDFTTVSVDGQQLTDDEMAELREAFLTDSGEVDEERLREFLQRLRGGGPEAIGTGPGAEQDDAAAGQADEEAAEQSPDAVAGIPQVEDRIERIVENPRLFVSSVETWLPRLSLLMVPFTMLAMAFMYFWRRKVFVYDHAIHALNLHSWIYLAATFSILLGWLFSPALGVPLFFLALPVYVTFSLRGAYRSGFVSSFLRMLVLSFFWLIGISVLSIGVAITSVLSV